MILFFLVMFTFNSSCALSSFAAEDDDLVNKADHLSLMPPTLPNPPNPLTSENPVILAEKAEKLIKPPYSVPADKDIEEAGYLYAKAAHLGYEEAYSFLSSILPEKVLLLIEDIDKNKENFKKEFLVSYKETHYYRITEEHYK